MDLEVYGTRSSHIIHGNFHSQYTQTHYMTHAEMDPLSAELDLEVNGMRMDLLAAVEEHANVAAQLEQQAGESVLCLRRRLCTCIEINGCCVLLDQSQS